MYIKVVILVLCVSAVLAYPAQEYTDLDEPSFDVEPVQGDIAELRVLRGKRQLNVQGGGSRGKGFDVNADARFKVWESQNKRNSVHGTAGYSQHLGGPYGNSRPDVRGGIQFTRRF